MNYFHTIILLLAMFASINHAENLGRTNKNLSNLIKLSGDSISSNLEYSHGGIIRADKTKKEIYLMFTGHEFADGYETITEVLNKNKIKAAFFFTGDFYRNENFEKLIYKLKEDGHYLGAHSDKHLLYASWEKRDSTLLTKGQLLKDVNDNYTEMNKFGIKKSDAKYFMPPFEWYNDEVSLWINEIDLTLINFTPGTLSNADWTIPELNEKYYSSDSIYNRILWYEQKDASGLNGFFLLTHIGTDERRTDKFYNRLDQLIVELKKRGYSFVRLGNN